MQKKPYIILASAAVIFVFLAGYMFYFFTKDNESLSGLYLCNDGHKLEWLKFKKVDEDNKLLADYKSIEMMEDGHLENVHGVVYGSIEGKNIAMSLRIGNVFNVPLSLSGFISGDNLNLTTKLKEENKGTRLFVPAKNDDYARAEMVLKQKAEQVLVKANAGRKLRIQNLSRDAEIKKLDEISRQMTAVYNIVDARLDQASKYSTMFEANTTRSQEGIQRMRELTDWRKKSDLVLELNQIVNDTEQVNTQVKNLEEEFLAQISVLNVGLVNAKKTCETYKDQVPSLLTWCAQFASAHQAFKDKTADVQGHFNVIKKDFLMALQKQNVIARTAEKMLENN